jgi:ankyrin repeat protein
MFMERRSLLIIFSIACCQQTQSSEQVAAPHVTLMSKEGNGVHLARTVAKNPLLSKLVSSAFEDQDIRELTVPISSANLRIMSACLQKLHDVVCAHPNFASLSFDQQTKYVLDQFAPIETHSAEMVELLTAAHTLQAPFLVELFSNLYAKLLHKDPKTIEQRMGRDQLAQELRIKIAQHYLIQFDTSIEKELGLTKKLSLPFSILITYGKLPDPLLKTIPGLDKNINNCVAIRNENKSALSLLAAVPDQANLKAAQSLLRVEDIDINTPQKNPPIITAAAAGFTEMVQLLLDAGAQVNSADAQGVTALMHAVRYGHPQTVKLLLDRGANVALEAHGYWNWTALMMAAYYSRGPVYRPGYDEIIELLIKGGADAQYALSQAKTRTLEERQRIQDALSSYATVQSLQVATASSPKPQNSVQLPPETFVIMSKDGHKFPLSRTVALATATFFQKAIQRSPTQQEFSINLPAVITRTLVAGLVHLHELGATVAGQKETVSEREVLAKLDVWLGKSADTHTVDFMKGAQLIGSPVLVELFSRKYAAQLHKSPSTLSKTIKTDHVPRTLLGSISKQYYLQFDEDIDAALGIKTSIPLPTLLAYEKVSEDFVKLFPRLAEDPNAVINFRGTNISSLALASGKIQYGGLKTVKALMKLEKIDINSPLSIPALIQAAYHNQPEIVATLIKGGARVNVTDPQGFSPLICATCVGSTSMVKMLLDHGGKVNVSNKQGQTPLMYAASSGSPEIVQLLLKKGAHVNHFTPANNFASPLMCAAQAGNNQTISLLVSHGANVTQAITHLTTKGYDQLVAQLVPHDHLHRGKK